MLFNSRSISLLLATSVTFLTVLSLSITPDVTVLHMAVVLLMTFTTSFVASFIALEFLIFKEIRKIYSVFNRIKTTTFQTDVDLQFPVKKISQQIFSYANTKEKEIEKLKKLESFRREFLADISHELKTPVFAAQGFIHTLLDGAVDDPNVRDKFLEKAARSLDDLDNLVQDLISISQLETGELKMQMMPFDIYDLVQDVVEQLEVNARHKGVVLKIDYRSGEDYLVIGDHYRIGQVLKNLIQNAIKYGTIQNKGEVTVVLKAAKEFINVAVTDKGPGIPEEHQERVFNRFYRIEKSRSREMGGTGLGLAIVKHILEAHGIKITLLSKEGKGTIFSFNMVRGEKDEDI